MKNQIMTASMTLAIAGSNLTAGETVPRFPDKAARKAFDTVLTGEDKRYDEKAKMLKRPFSSPGYHTTLKGGEVHSTVDSLRYAVALLDSGEEDRKERAFDVLRKVISLQDQNPESNTYGIWSWFLEEPLDKMSPPDWNWADFCGTQLLQVAHGYIDILPDDLKSALKDSIMHAAGSIKKRNVQPGYTNIALMGTYVTLVAGEIFNDKELFEYGRERLKKFCEYTQDRGSFSEYNSPNYTVVAVEEISRMLMHVKDPECRKNLDELNQFAWLHVARHFHPHTQQWAGPHSRSYSTILQPRQLAFIQRALDGKAKFMNDKNAWKSLEACRLRPSCPAEYVHFFTQLPEPRNEVEVFNKKGAGPHDIVGTTYLHPDFTLGSVNIGNLWNQSRAAVAYWKTAKGPVAMRLRCLHDGYDYSSASIFSVQNESRVLSAVNFATDRGDTHISLDKIKAGSIMAKDLRLRLEFEGDTESVKIERIADRSQAGQYEITSENISILFSVPYAAFGDNQTIFETCETLPHVDIVLYSGPSRKINFSQLDKAAAVIAIAISSGKKPAFPDVSISTDEKTGILKAELLAGNARTISLSVPVKPMATAEQNKMAYASFGKANPWNAEK